MSKELNHELRELRREAKRLVKGVHAEDEAALQRVAESHPRFRSVGEAKSMKLADAQLVLAREREHASW